MRRVKRRPQVWSLRRGKRSVRKVMWRERSINHRRCSIHWCRVRRSNRRQLRTRMLNPQMGRKIPTPFRLIKWCSRTMPMMIFNQACSIVRPLSERASKSMRPSKRMRGGSMKRRNRSSNRNPSRNPTHNRNRNLTPSRNLNPNTNLKVIDQSVLNEWGNPKNQK